MMEKIKLSCKGRTFYINHPEELLPECGYFIDEIFNGIRDIITTILLREGIKDGFTITIERGGEK